MKKAARFVLQGTVQGIFFRQFVKEHSEDLKLRGFVRNLESIDGVSVGPKVDRQE